MKVIDLFCGAGGFSEGFERAGFEIIKAYDIWAPAILTHNMNHGNNKEIACKGDVYAISILPDEEFEKFIPDSEVIIGSPPCIAFSNSNKSGKADKTEGVKLINAFLRIVARKMSKKNSKLKYWVMENVENALKYTENEYNASDLEWEELGDFILEIPQKNVFNMKYFGAPTNRKRSICGNYPDIKDVNSESEILTLGRIQSALGTPNPNGYESSNKKIIDPIYGITISEKDLTDHHYIKEIPVFEWKKAKRQKEDKGYMGKMSFPENPNNPARTIMATLSGSSRESMILKMEGEIERYRYPTIREAATLMSFPIDFRFYGESDSVKYRMIGNAVTPKFSYEIAKIIRQNIKNSESKDAFSKKKSFNDKIPFYNLNGEIFNLKVEKPKKNDASFSYHIPYLIDKSFRVGLENNFNDENLTWVTKIHYSQGKNAKKYEDIFISLNIFEENEVVKMHRFIKSSIQNIGSFRGLQEVYCQTLEQRNELGPEELLQDLRDLIDTLESLDRNIYICDIGRNVSLKIIFGYYVLKNILEGLEND